MMSTSFPVSTDFSVSTDDCSPDPADMHSLKNSMGNVTDTITRSIKTTLQLSLALVVLLGLTAGPAMAQLTLQANDGSTADEDGSTDTITQSELEYTTASGDADDVIYEITSQPATSEGTLFLGGTALSQGDTFSQQDINDDLLTYEYDPSSTIESDGFNFEVNDGNDTDTDGFQIDINNLDPTPTDDQFDTDESQTAFSVNAANGVLANDSDPGQDDIEVARFDLDESGVFGTAAGGNDTSGDGGDSGDATNVELTVDADGSFTVTLNGRDDDSEGTLDFKYQVEDSDGATSRGDVTINIDNLTPTADNDAYAVASTSTLNQGPPGLLSNDTDPRAPGVDTYDDLRDGTGVAEVNGSSGNVGSTITLSSGADLAVDSDGSFDYDPNGFVGDDTFTYTAEDGEGATDQATVTITSYQAGIYVSGDFSGSSSAPVGTPPNPYTSLSNALSSASDGDDIFIASARYSENVEVLNDNLTFKGWNGESGSDLATSGGGNVVTVDAEIAGDLTVGDVTETSNGVDPVDLTLFEGFTLSVSTNSVLTLASEGTSAGTFSQILGDGQVFLATSGGEVNVGVDEDINDATTAEQTLKGRIQDIRVEKSGGLVTFERFSSRSDPGLGAIFQVGDTDEDALSRFQVLAGDVQIQQNVEVAFNADTGTDGSPADPFPVFEIDDTQSTDDDARVFGPGTVSFNVVGENQFETAGTGTLGTLFVQNNAPSFGGDSDQEGTVVTFSEIGNGGESIVNEDVLRLSNLTRLVGTLTADGSDVDVTAPVFGTLTSDLNVENEAVVSVGGELTVQGETDIEGESTLNANDDAEFQGVVDILGESTLAVFDGETTFNSTLNVRESGDPADPATATFNDFASFQDVNLASTLNFNAPGVVDTSTIKGDLTHGGSGSSTIRLADDTDNGNGSHSLELEGDLRLTNGNELRVDQQDDGHTPDDVDTPRTTSFDFTGTGKQEIVDVNDNGGSVTGTDRVELDNSASPRALELVNGVNLEVGDKLTLTEGNFVTNGGLDMSDGLTSYTPVLVRRSEGQDDTGRLADGTGNFAYTGVDDDPVRIEYRGSSNMATTEELLPADQAEGDRNVEELAVIFEGEPIDSEGDEDVAVLTLGIDYSYSVEDTLAVRKGNLAFSAQSSLELGNGATFIRGDGELITEEVTDPDEGLDRPGVSTVGVDGFNITYVNELTTITTGVAFNKANADQVLDLTVDNASDVLLAAPSDVDDLEETEFRVNRDVEVTSGSVFDFNAQELEMNTTETIGSASFTVVNDGSIVGGDGDAEDGSTLKFIGEGQANVIGDVNDGDAKVFVFPETEVEKDGASGPRRVEFQMDDANSDQADGFEFDGNFRMLAAANWSLSDDDGVEFESDDGDEDVDVVRVMGNFSQMGGSFLAFDDHTGSEFTVDDDFTKNADEDSRFYAGGSGSVDDFTVGTENDTLSQANGTFYAIVNNAFTVNGEVVNESPDKWDVDGFTSEAFEVDGADNATAEITGSVTQDTTGTPRGDNAGTFRVEGFEGDDGKVLVNDSFNNFRGITELVEATRVRVANEVIVESDSMSVNLGATTQEQRFRASTLSVASADGSSSPSAKSFHDPDAVFEASTQSSVATPSGLSDEPANPEPSAEDQIRITGNTDVESSGQFFLEGFELRQSGNFRLVGFGDRPWSDDESPGYTRDESGLLGLVRFVNDGDKPQTVETRGEVEDDPMAPSTYFHGLAVRATGDVRLTSDIVLNEASGGQGNTSDVDGDSADDVASGTLRPFGTLFLENGNLITDRQGDYRITILAPEPSDGEDLVEAVSANEARNGDPVEASPVLGGSNTTKVVGTMRRALAEQNEDTGGIVTDGYVYPLGKAGQENRPRYRGLVLELPSDETEPEFFTVENIDDPNEPLPDGGITSVDANDPDSTIQLDEQSLPYYRVESEDGDPNFNSFNMRVISKIGGVREVNQVRLIQRNGDWMQAGGDGAYDRNRGSEIDDDEQETTGGPNASISGFTNAVHEGVDLRDGNTIALATSSEKNPNFGQFDAPGLTLASDQDAEVNAAVGEGGVDINFKLDDPDSDIPADSFNVVQSTSASSIDPDSVSFQVDRNEDAPDDVTVTFTPDTEDAEASFTDDESRLPLDQFEGSDPLTLEVEVEDEAEITDVASVGVNVDLQPGDADSDGNVGSTAENAQDARVALDEFLLGPDTDSPSELTPVAFNAADIRPDGGDGRVDAYDASGILSGDFGTSSSALAGKSAQGGKVVIGSVENGAIPLTLSEDASGIRSASVELSLDASVSDVSADLPSGWIIDHATKEDGTLRVGLAGTSALSSGQQIASIQLDGSAAEASTDLEPEGTYRLNGSDAKDMRVDIGPEEFALEGNYPNPFTQATTIPYQLSESADVTLEVYDMLGRKIGTLVDKQQSSGQYEVNVNQSKVGQSLSSGVYIYRLEAGDFQDTGKMTVVK